MTRACHSRAAVRVRCRRRAGRDRNGARRRERPRRVGARGRCALHAPARMNPPGAGPRGRCPDHRQDQRLRVRAGGLTWTATARPGRRSASRAVACRGRVPAGDRRPVGRTARTCGLHGLGQRRRPAGAGAAVPSVRRRPADRHAVGRRVRRRRTTAATGSGVRGGGSVGGAVAGALS